jgi:hypothetical protein
VAIEKRPRCRYNITRLKKKCCKKREENWRGGYWREEVLSDCDSPQVHFFDLA